MHGQQNIKFNIIQFVPAAYCLLRYMRHESRGPVYEMNWSARFIILFVELILIVSEILLQV